MAKRRLGRPRSPERTVQISVVLPVTVRAKALKLARAEGLSLAAWVRRLVLRELERVAATSEDRAA